MGHSTGSQDVIHYLTSPSSSSLTKVDGGIMQAPASDRQYFQGRPDAPTYKLWADGLKVAEGMLEEGKGEGLMSEEFCKEVGCPMTAYRLHSLVGIGSVNSHMREGAADEKRGR